MIKHVPLNHGLIYDYKYDERRRAELKELFPALSNYLELVYHNCPATPFFKGPRSSSLKATLNINLIGIEGHEVCHFAQTALSLDPNPDAHSIIEAFMLEYDPKTIAVEVPVWLLESESEECYPILRKGPLSGHIDILRFENNRIWVWDYKPRAEKEKYAPIQTFLYAYMLSKRTGIGLEHFMCGYFSKETSYIFNPSEINKEELCQMINS